MPSSTPFSQIFYIYDDATISPARVQIEPSLRKRKRQRVEKDERGVAQDESRGDFTDEEPEESQSKMGSSYNPLSYQRDPDYYPSGKQREDEVVVRVQRTLFKIPRSVLENLPNICATKGDWNKAYTDLNPLEINFMICKSYDPATSDQMETFRAILWGINVLHGGDQELLNKTPETYEEVERILSVSSVAKDLEIPKWEEWAIHTARLAANDDVFLDSCSSMTLRLVIQVASSATPPVLPIVARVATRWGERVRNKKAPSVPAILAAEAYTSVRSNPYVPEVRALCGISYYVQLQDMDECQTFEKDGIVTKLRTDRKLTNEQTFKLLTGHYCLVRFWQNFRLNPFKIPLDDKCSEDRHAKCSAVWTKRWASAVGWKRIMTLNEADALGLIACLKSQLGEDDELKAGMAPGCRLVGLEMLEKKRDEVDANLMSHFLGCI